MLVRYYYNNKNITGIPIRNFKGQTIANVWSALQNTFKLAGTPPKICSLDNEVSKDLI